MNEVMVRIGVGVCLGMVGLLSFVYLPDPAVLFGVLMVGYGLYRESISITYQRSGYVLACIPVCVLIYMLSVLQGSEGVKMLVIQGLGMIIGSLWLLRVYEMLLSQKRFLSKSVLFSAQLIDISGALIAFWLLFLRDKWGLFMVILTVVGIDTVGYFVGRFFGKRKACPTISPNKTIEGYLGALVWVVFCAISILMIDKEISILRLTLGMGMIYILSIIGDLLVSHQKRLLNIKDSSSLLPGHGGLLDRLDSVIFVLVFVLVTQ